jgi:hypothetical protein
MNRSATVASIAVIVASLISCLTAPNARANLVIPDRFLGVAHAGYSNSAAEYDLLRLLGADFSRIDFSWDLIEPRKGEFDFSRYDAIVETAVAHGFGILAILDYDVSWIHEGGTRRNFIPPGGLGSWLEYVERVVGRYRGRVFAYEIWNEPNWFFWKGSAQEFAALTRETAGVIRRNDPGAAIIAGAFSRAPRRFARTMLRDGAFDQVDAVSFHPYARNALAVVTMSTRFMDYLRSLGYQGTFWITESGYTTRGIYPNTILEREYSSELVKTITLLAATGVERIVWYTLTDRYSANEKPRGENLVSIAEAYFGLAYPDYSPKPGTYAYAAIAHILPGSTYAPGAVAIAEGLHGVRIFPFIRKDGRLALVAWSDSEITLELSMDIRGETVEIDSSERKPFSGRILATSRKPVILLSDFRGEPDGSHPIVVRITTP